MPPAIPACPAARASKAHRRACSTGGTPCSGVSTSAMSAKTRAEAGPEALLLDVEVLQFMATTSAFSGLMLSGLTPITRTPRLASACEKHLPGFDSATLRDVSRLSREGHWLLWDRSQSSLSDSPK